MMQLLKTKNLSWQRDCRCMEAYPQPFDLVDPVLDFISKHPEVDFGAPGELVHFVERFIIKAMRNY